MTMHKNKISSASFLSVDWLIWDAAAVTLWDGHPKFLTLSQFYLSWVARLWRPHIFQLHTGCPCFACRTIDLNCRHSNTHISPQGAGRCIFLKWDCTTPTYFSMVNVQQFLCWNLIDFKLSGSNIFGFYSASAKKIQLPLNVTEELPLICFLAVLFCLVLSYLAVVGNSY